MSETKRYEKLYLEWKKIQNKRSKLKELQQQKKKISKDIRSLSQLIPKLLDEYDDKV